jgi:hypothetical protein
MLRVITLLAVTTITAVMVRTVYRDMVEEVRYSNFISSGRFLTEEYNSKRK